MPKNIQELHRHGHYSLKQRDGPLLQSAIAGDSKLTDKR